MLQRGPVSWQGLPAFYQGISSLKSATPRDRLRVGWVNGCEGFHESRKCSRDAYPESYTTEYTLVYEDKTTAGELALESYCPQQETLLNPKP